jgi:hypothetical protein
LKKFVQTPNLFKSKIYPNSEIVQIRKTKKNKNPSKPVKQTKKNKNQTRKKNRTETELVIPTALLMVLVFFFWGFRF